MANIKTMENGLSQYFRQIGVYKDRYRLHIYLMIDVDSRTLHLPCCIGTPCLKKNEKNVDQLAENGSHQMNLICQQEACLLDLSNV